MLNSKKCSMTIWGDSTHKQATYHCLSQAVNEGCPSVYHLSGLFDTKKVQRCLGYPHQRTPWHWQNLAIKLTLSVASIHGHKSVLPRWVNDYHQINTNTVTDSYPLPWIDNILADCTKGKIWGKLDMTNLFFKTQMHPDDIKYTMVMTPRGAFKWMVMPVGFKNAPSTH